MILVFWFTTSTFSVNSEPPPASVRAWTPVLNRPSPSTCPLTLSLAASLWSSPTVTADSSRAKIDFFGVTGSFAVTPASLTWSVHLAPSQ